VPRNKSNNFGLKPKLKANCYEGSPCDVGCECGVLWNGLFNATSALTVTNDYWRCQSGTLAKFLEIQVRLYVTSKFKNETWKTF